MVGVRALDPHPLLTEYALLMTPRTGKVYTVSAMFAGDTGRTVDVFKSLLKEARSTYDWDTCEYEKSSGAEIVRLEKGDRSIVVSFSSGESGRVSASIRFLDGKSWMMRF